MILHLATFPSTARVGLLSRFVALELASPLCCGWLSLQSAIQMYFRLVFCSIANRCSSCRLLWCREVEWTVISGLHRTGYLYFFRFIFWSFWISGQVWQTHPSTLWLCCSAPIFPYLCRWQLSLGCYCQFWLSLSPPWASHSSEFISFFSFRPLSSHFSSHLVMFKVQCFCFQEFASLGWDLEPSYFLFSRHCQESCIFPP